MARNKPRKSESRIITKYDDVKVKNTKRATDLPAQYLVVPNEGWQSRVDTWDEKLRKRGLKIRTPLNVVRFTRIVETVETVVEVEKA